MTKRWRAFAPAFAAPPDADVIPPLRWTEQAVDQLGAIADYISLASPLYAERVIERIVARLEQARRFPQSGRAVPEWRDPQIREFIESPYRLIYRPGVEAIEVLAIVHTRQKLELHIAEHEAA